MLVGTWINFKLLKYDGATYIIEKIGSLLNNGSVTKKI